MRFGALVALGLLLIMTLPAFAVQRMVVIEEFTNVG
jgi:hypothetical protein